MRRVPALFSCILGLLSFVTAAAADAAPVAPDQNASATVRIDYPATFRRLNDLNFAYIGVTAAGTAIIDPNTDTMTTTGGVVHVGGLPYAALFEAISPNRTVVIIRVPKNPITLTRVGGTETMTVSNWTLSGDSKKTVKANEPFNFKVGGTLNVGANQTEGTYLGTFTVELQYP